MPEFEEDVRTPEELVRVFERSVNYPRDAEGIILLAQGLARAAARYGVEMQAIIRRCADLSERCPTDAYLMDAARLIHEEQERAAADRRHNQHDEWREQYGAPKPLPLGPVKVNYPGHWAHGMDWQVAVDKAHADRAKIVDKLCAHFKVKDLSRISLHDKYTAMRSMGYPLTPEQKKYL